MISMIDLYDHGVRGVHDDDLYRGDLHDDHDDGPYGGVHGDGLYDGVHDDDLYGGDLHDVHDGDQIQYRVAKDQNLKEKRYNNGTKTQR